MLCVLGLALLAMAAADLRRINDSAEQNTRTQLRLLHDILHDEFSAIVRSFDETTHQLSDQIGLNNTNNIRTRLELLKSALPAMQAIVVRDAAGNILGQTGEDAVRYAAQQDLIPAGAEIGHRHAGDEAVQALHARDASTGDTVGADRRHCR